jgi:hypothetical protein
MTIERRPLRSRLWAHRRELLLLAEAVCGLALAALTLKLRPFARVARNLTCPVRPAVVSDPNLLSRRVRWAVLAASKRVPWGSVCFDQAIAAQRMLRRRGIAADLVYGVRKSEQGLDAHVWLRLAGGWIVVGGEQARLFQPIALFRPGQDDAIAPPDDGRPCDPAVPTQMRKKDAIAD